MLGISKMESQRLYIWTQQRKDTKKHLMTRAHPKGTKACKSSVLLHVLPFSELSAKRIIAVLFFFIPETHHVIAMKWKGNCSILRIPSNRSLKTLWTISRKTTVSVVLACHEASHYRDWVQEARYRNTMGMIFLGNLSMREILVTTAQTVGVEVGRQHSLWGR